MNVLLVRANRNERDAAALRALGISSIVDPYLNVSSVDNPVGISRMRGALSSDDSAWLIVTSPNVLDYLDQAMGPGELDGLIRGAQSLRFAAIGRETQRQLRQRGAAEVFIPLVATSQGLAIELTNTPPCVAVIPHGSLAMRDLADALSEAGFTVVREAIYATETVSVPPLSVGAVASGEIDAVLLRSPSAVRAFVQYNGVPGTSVFCAGPTTAAEARAQGLTVQAIAKDPSPESVAATIATYLEENHA